ncbi:uncharacterized mitochondrial protein AtMg00810-like [Ziziphus jujuba]|uniref:Uncharacterized mitochondrial protein AtMg00810-like n=1 Tax=Ziziphus jujuba TaxID=326968 RepID=A0ABM3ZUC9_ZIZJJ|nr:uncharacterized mitochondrial protein AtMg00810-like [Ziziphus jujuba]
MRDYESREGLYEEENTAYQALFVGSDPVSFGDAVKSMKWKKTMDVEIEAIERNDTWKLIDLPVEAKKVGVKWVYKTKLNENGEVDKYKAQLTGKECKILIVCLYVDDLIFTRNDESMFVEFKKSMMIEFDMTDLGKMRYFLGIEVMQRSDGIFISHRKYTQEVLERFNMDKCNPIHNPIVPGCKLMKTGDGVRIDSIFYKQIVENLMYLTATRPDVMFVVSHISRFMDCPTKLYLQAAKRILRYLKGIIDFGVFYKKGGNEKLIAYTDSNYARDLDDRKSTSGYVFMLSIGAMSWSSKKQPVISLSTTEVEFIAATLCVSQVIWLRRILEGFKHAQHDSTIVYCDNSSTIKLSKNLVMHGCSKHIDVRFHFLRKLTKDGIVEMVHCHTQEQVVDIMTKPLKLDVFLKMCGLLGICLDPGVN